jgi:hypothetical protein
MLGGNALGIVWLLTTGAVERHKRAFWAASKAVIPTLLERYPSLSAAIDARYDRALRWAARLGGDVRAAKPSGASGLPFHPVIWGRHG